jgi:bifunctional DNase/RNase
MSAATDVSFAEMRVAKVVGFQLPGEEGHTYVVLDEVAGTRHMVVGIGDTEAFLLTAGLQGMQWPRPMTYDFTAALVRGLGGQVRQVRLDRVLDGAYAATVEVDGPVGTAHIDARMSDALNLAVVLGAPVFADQQILADCDAWLAGDSAAAARGRLALTAEQGTIRRADDQPGGQGHGG